MGEIAIRTPDSAELTAEGASVVTRARAMQVTCIEEHADALAFQAWCRKRELFGTELFEPARKSLQVAKDEVLSIRDRAIGPFAEARELVAVKARAFKTAEEEKARQEARRLAALARAAEEERRLAEAVQAEAEGEDPDIILNEPPPPEPVIHVEAQVAHVEGVGETTRYSVAIDDVSAFLVWVGAHPEFHNLVGLKPGPGTPGMNALGRAQREAFSIPGLRLVKTEGQRYGR